MKKLCTFFAVCGLVFVAALIAGCSGLLDAGVATNISRDSNSLIGGGTFSGTNIGEGGGYRQVLLAAAPSTGIIPE